MPKLSRSQIIILVVLVLAICFLTAIILFLFGEILIRPGPAHSKTGTPAIDDSWERVKQAGKLVVGTSADYPPFEYYTSDFKMEGFDIALVSKIGEELGVTVEIQDITFDGLIGALQVKQIDLAIAAISMTPDRASVVDFSDVYYSSADAVLARQDSNIQVIQSPDDLAHFRLGVQNSSIYESWVRNNLILMGKMPATNMFVYALIDQALNDLNDNKIDLVLMDLLPAQVFAHKGGYKIVGQGVNVQQYAMAVSKGSASLLSEINDALGKLQSQGQVSQLAQQYLNQDPNLPTPTPAPPPTPSPTLPPLQPTPTFPAPACVDGMAFVQDLTYPDYQMTNPPIIQPGAPFQKGWRLRNTGTCTWNTSYVLVYANGNSPSSNMSGVPTPIVSQVPPGGTYDIYVNLVAPYWPGVYQGFWVLQNGSNVPFGQRIWVGINVPSPIQPTQTPSPFISFTADRTNINAGERVVFNWNVQNASQVYFYAEGDLLARGQSQSFIGRAEVYPNLTTMYDLLVVKMDNTQEIRQILITVQQSQNPPVITQFTVDPAQIDLGSCVNIAWNVEGDTNNITIFNDGNVLQDGAPMAGSMQDCPGSPGTLTYRIQAVGPGGTANQQVSIDVQQRVGPLPVPVIDYFTVSPDTIPMGECVNISWNVTGGAVNIQILRDGQVIEDQAPTTGGTQDCPASPGVVTYSIQVSGSGGSASDQGTVDVMLPVDDTPVPPPDDDTPFPPPDDDTPIPPPDDDTPIPPPDDDTPIPPPDDDS